MIFGEANCISCFSIFPLLYHIVLVYFIRRFFQILGKY